MKVRRGVVVLLLSLLSTQVVHAATVPFASSRPFNVFIPSTYEKSDPVPLVIALSGYGQTGAQLENYLHLTSEAQSAGFIYVHPDGTIDQFGARFWNATPECCDFQKPPVNDAAYIISIIKKISARYSVDPKRIYVIGHSNGGFMANALALHLRLHVNRALQLIFYKYGEQKMIPTPTTIFAGNLYRVRKRLLVTGAQSKNALHLQLLCPTSWT
jgi:pimeloyl-ACP methyl ester carboxylesterase